MKSVYRIIYLFLFTLGISSCLLDPSYNQSEHYIIPKGSHYSVHRFHTYTHSASVSFNFMFNESAVYTVTSPDQADINKLAGFAEGAPTAIHENSARFGWRWFNDRLEIHAYAYTSGVRKSVCMGNIEIGKTYYGKIISHENSYEFIFLDTSFFLERDVPFSTIFGDSIHLKRYISHPFFGGNQKAPHDITIALTFLDP